MAALDIVVGKLRSRIERRSVGTYGVRRIEAPLASGGSTGSGIISKILNFAGWLTSGVKSLFRFSASGVWGGIVQTTAFLWHFNWNASDEQLDAQLEGIQNQIATVLGTTFGNLAGYYVCGMLPASKMLRFNEALGARILEEVSEEAFDEFANNLAQLCRTAWYLTAAATITTAYKNTRRVIKGIFENPDSPQSQALEAIFGDKTQEAIAAWGNDNQPWTFAEEVDDRVDSIDNTYIRNFTEEFLEEFFDSCVEAGYIVAHGIDAFYAQQRLQRDIILGSEEGVEIKPNRESDERIVLVGREQLIKPVITQTMANSQFVENRDIGQIMGLPTREHVKRERLKLSVKIVWKSTQKPPWGKADLVECTIPQVDRTKLEWQLIKSLAGGENGFTTGRFLAIANLTGGFQMKIWGATEQEAESRLKALLQLSEETFLTINITELTKQGERAAGKPMEKESYQVYPAYMTILNQTKTLNQEQKGIATLTGLYKRRDQQILLWTSREPRSFKSVVSELLSRT